MATNLQMALKQDYADYKKQLTAFEKEKMAIERKIESLNKKYSEVLELIQVKTKRKRYKKRARRGQTKEFISAILKKSKKPLKAYEIIQAITEKGWHVSNASIRQQLPKLVSEGVLKKNKDKAYLLK